MFSSNCSHIIFDELSVFVDSGGASPRYWFDLEEAAFTGAADVFGGDDGFGLAFVEDAAGGRLALPFVFEL